MDACSLIHYEKAAKHDNSKPHRTLITMEGPKVVNQQIDSEVLFAQLHVP